MDFGVYLRRVGKNLRRARWRAGMTQQQAATAAGTTVRYLADLERGTRNPSLRMLTELAQLLDVRVADLVEVGERREPVDLSQVSEASAPKPGRKPSKGSHRSRPSR